MSVSLDQYLVFVSIATLIVVTPGPNLFLLLTQASGSHQLMSIFTVLGICLAILSHATFALFGVGAIIATSTILFTVLKVAGAGYLIWMGLKSLWSLKSAAGSIVLGKPQRDDTTCRKAFIRGYLVNSC